MNSTYFDLRSYETEKNELINRNPDSQEIICEPRGFVLVYEDLLPLCRSTSTSPRDRYLNDSLINCYLSLVLNTERISIPDKTFVFNSNFCGYLRYADTGKNYTLDFLNNNGIGKNRDFLNSSVILIPIHVSHGHWILVILNRDDKTCIQIDSMNKNSFYNEIKKHLETFLQAKIPGNQFEESRYTFHCEISARQADSASCGIYLILNILNRLKIIDFSIESNPSFLRQIKLIMIHEFLHFYNDPECFVLDVLGTSSTSQ